MGGINMNPSRTEYLFLGVLAVGVLGISIPVIGTPEGYLSLALLLLLCGVLGITRTWKDRGFYLVCGGEPLVVICSITNLWAGVFSVCMLAGIVCRAWGLHESHRDLIPFVLFCCGTGIIALIITLSNHVLPALLAIGSITAVILTIQSVRSYQFRKQCTGA